LFAVPHLAAVPAELVDSDSPSRIAFGFERFLGMGEIAQWLLPAALLGAAMTSVRAKSARVAVLSCAALLAWLNTGWYVFQGRMDDGKARRFAEVVTRQVSGSLSSSSSTVCRPCSSSTSRSGWSPA
jgi:hypothetical protein